ncbi:MAG: DUF2148 domain-containing protein [Eubacteriaceae bacterium]|nr:DUF2148 domain-containing protein [Eubacteriaceae bacterium]
MIKNMEQSERDAVLRVADGMAAAARTAPKGSGKDKIVTVIVTEEDKDRLAECMRQLYDETGLEIFKRDAGNVDASTCVVIMGAKGEPFGMPCGMCGFENCAQMVKAGANCAFNITDLGIAVGSAVALAADNRIDNRVMYTAGQGAIKMGCFSEDVRVAYGIPLYTGSKSIFFDRNPGAVIL